MNVFVLIVLALGVYRLCRLIIEDRIFERPREALFRLNKRWLSYLISCYWCLSIWVSATVLLLNLIVPAVVFWMMAVLAISAIVGFIDEARNR